MSARLVVTEFGLLAPGGAAVPFDSLSLARGQQTPATSNVRFDVASIKIPPEPRRAPPRSLDGTVAPAVLF